ncbi:Oidioi.mRNA.OKI2018_I69.chr1.g459.t1.cds [Oikopleura dioica]|uniref:Oidioi.mRNA.OKI2018_I69.chr1.g459.t1.cds n=1 Tax=Oikopleura dioica TaxID=34765 RepID=A0ABN7SLL0_OIKDI|nr:Oidioi.mRNA.OKI2018_I69.chr1.g459.t1.cds [Oikopleura dioica]
MQNTEKDCFEKYFQAQSALFCNDRICDADCRKYSFVEVVKAEEEALFDFDCRAKVLGPGRHICENQQPIALKRNEEGSGWTTTESPNSSAQNISSSNLIFLIFLFLLSKIIKS